MGCRCAHWLKAWRLPCVRQYPDHDVVPPSSLEGCPQMHQTTDRRFRPERPWGLEAQIDHPPYGTLDLARADGEFARLQSHIAHAMRVGLQVAQGPRDGLAPMRRGQCSQRLLHHLNPVGLVPQRMPQALV